MRAVVGKDICRDLGQTMVSEWLDTNGCGGFASSTIAGMNTRRYHSLLIASLDAPVGRVAYLSSIQETATVGSHSLELGCNVYHDVVHPRATGISNTYRWNPIPFSPTGSKAFRSKST
jgi:glycogen debranching enzyme